MLFKSFNIIFLLIFFSLITKIDNVELQCKNEKGENVDWFIIYKLPIIPKETEYVLRKGLAYAYITSENSSSGWKLSQLSINDTRSIPGQTLLPIYGNITDQYLWLLYNDEPPSASTSLTYGHTKGVLLSDGTKGYWLVHSVPNFPIEPISEIKINGSSIKRTRKNNYFYPNSALRYGQTFLCISMDISQLNNVGKQFLFNKPKVYSKNIPSFIESSVPNINLVVKKNFVKTPPWYNKQTVKSLTGDNFVSFAKTSQFGKELYSDWLAVDLEDNLNVETWSNGAGDIPSECTKPFIVQDVRKINLQLNKQKKIDFKSTQDHSKWAVSLDRNKPWLCIGDINRMTAQLKRGGGTVCFNNTNVWGLFSRLVDEVESCKRNISSSS